MTQQNDDTKTIYRAICLIWIALSFFSCGLLAGAEKKARIAIVTDKASDAGKLPLVSLLEVRLSESASIELLEREHIDSILDEHKLSLTGLVQRDDIIRAGKLLRADAFLLLSLEKSTKAKDGGGDLLRIRIVETSYGIRLVDTFEQVDAEDVPQAVERIASKTNNASQKLTIPHEESIAAGIVDVQRASLADRHKRLANVLPAMLSSCLGKEPRIIILEREDLKLLLREKQLTEGRNRDFLNSAVIINGHLQPKGRNGVKLTLSLKGSSTEDTTTFTVSLDPNEPGKAVDEMAINIIKEILNAEPTSLWQPKQEAEEFFRHGQNLMNHSEHKEALAPLETAHALQPDNIYYTNALFVNECAARRIELFRSRRKSFHEITVCYSNVELANAASCLVRQMRAKYNDGSLSASDVDSLWSNDVCSYPLYGYFNSPASVSTPEIRNINRESRRIWTETCQKAFRETGREPTRLIELAWVSSDKHAEVMQNLREALGEFILPPEMGGRFRSADRRHKYCRSKLSTGGGRNLRLTHLTGQEESFRKLWTQYIQELAENKDPLVRFMSCLTLARSVRLSSEISAPQAKAYWKQALKIMPTVLETYNDSFPEWKKSQIHEDMYEMYGKTVGYNKNEFLGVIERIIEPMIENKDVDKLVVWTEAYCFGNDKWPTTIEGRRRYIQFLERIAEVLQTRGNHKPEVIRRLNRIRDYQSYIRRKFPELKPPQKRMSFALTMLLGKKDSLLEARSCKVTIDLQGHMLWIGFAENYASQGDGLFLAGIDLAKKEPVALWRSDTARKSPYRNITCMAIGKDATYVSLNAGLVEFPGSLTKGRGLLKAPKILTQANGLPSIRITSMTRVKNKLWIAYGGKGKECGLGLYDPKTEVWENVFSSALKDSPVFNNGQQSRLIEMTFAPPNELFFYARDVRYSEDQRPSSRTDFWKLNTNTRQLDKVSMDVKMEMRKEMVASGDFDFGNISRYTAAVYDKKLWALQGRSGLIIMPEGKGREEAEILDNNILEGTKVLRFLSTEYGLIAVGEGTVGLIESTCENKQSYQKVNK